MTIIVGEHCSRSSRRRTARRSRRRRRRSYLINWHFYIQSTHGHIRAKRNIYQTTSQSLIRCHSASSCLNNNCEKASHLSHLIYPLTVKVAGARAPQMISQPVSSIFPCSPLPPGTWRTPGLSIPWWCLPPSSSVCLVFFPLSLCWQEGFGQTLWTGDMTVPLQFASLYDGQEVFVWSDCQHGQPRW